jgi:hypothetical protein
MRYRAYTVPITDEGGTLEVDATSGGAQQTFGE